MTALAAVVLAAGAGTRLAPLTRLLPKALCPVGNRALVDHALDRVQEALALCGTSSGPDTVAVNAHHGVAALRAHLEGRVHLSVEAPVALGTAGALGVLRQWTAGRDVLVTNADAWLGPLGSLPLRAFLDSWDRERVRLWCVPTASAADFGNLRYAGMCLLPGRLAATFDPIEEGLYERCWRYEYDAGRLDLFEHDGPFVDVGTPAAYLAANLAAASSSSDPEGLVAPSASLAPGGSVVASVIGAGASVAGSVAHSVVWPGSVVARGEVLRHAVRAGTLTVLVR